MGTDEGYGNIMTAEEKAADVQDESECSPKAAIKLEEPPAALRCTTPACFCLAFCPGQEVIRCCEACGHGWLSHALPQQPRQSDLEHAAGLVLFGCQAMPIRLKILLDRLFSSVARRQLSQLLLQFGWTLDDYARGYVVRDGSGRRLDSWQMCGPEEEAPLVRQFVRFGETRALALQLLAACDGPQGHAHALPPSPARTSPPASPPHAASGKARLPPLDCSQDGSPGARSPLLATPPSTSASLWPGARSCATPAVLASPGASHSDGASSEECNGAPDMVLDLSRDGCSPRAKPSALKVEVGTPWPTKNRPAAAPAADQASGKAGASLGKKRVQCNVCLKTFCDKGALKIHFSAVHLREMHKCTVEGCNMMFSSRRSRNRHSANPNPKLHQPQFRRADVSLRYPSPSKASSGAGLGAGVGGGVAAAEDALSRVLGLRLVPGARAELRFEDSSNAATAHTSSEDSSMSPTNGLGFDAEYDADAKESSGVCEDNADDCVDGKPEPSWLKRLQRRWQEESACESRVADPAPAPAENTQRGTRKRKSQHPTRCAVTGETAAKIFVSESAMSEDDSCL